MTTAQHDTTEVPSQETWLPVVGFESFYEVSSLGRIRNIKQRQGSKAGRILRGAILNRGYPYVRLRHGTGGVTFQIHTIVARAFLGPCPTGHEVNHKDGNKTNAAANNLEYRTRSGNMTHAYDNGLAPLGAKRWNARLTEEQVREIKRRLAFGEQGTVIAEAFGVSPGTIYAIKKRKCWRRVN